MTSTLYGDRLPAALVTVHGRPVPGGSKRAFAHRHTGKIILIDMGKGNKAWKLHVAREGRKAFAGPPLSGPLEVFVIFTVSRPKGHYRAGRYAHLLRPDAPDHPTGRPDTTKLLRAFEDALTGVLWPDDAQIVSQHASKRYGDQPGASVAVFRVGEGL